MYMYTKHLVNIDNYFIFISDSKHIIILCVPTYMYVEMLQNITSNNILGLYNILYLFIQKSVHVKYHMQHEI